MRNRYRSPIPARMAHFVQTYPMWILLGIAGVSAAIRMFGGNAGLATWIGILLVVGLAIITISTG